MSLISDAKTEIRRQLRNGCKCQRANVWLAPEHAEALLARPKKRRKKK